MKKTNKSKVNKGNIVPSNVETGKQNWNWQQNRKYDYRINEDNLKAYKQQQLSNARKVGGGILNTNVETGNWYGMQFIVPEKSDRIGPGDIKAQEKFFAGQLKETITGPLPSQKGQNAPVKFNNNANWGNSNYNQNYRNNLDNINQFVQSNNNNYDNYPNYNYIDQQKKFEERENNYVQNYNKKEINNNYDDINLEKLMEAGPGVLKVQATEKFIFENGVKKKVTKIKKYMESGEVREEIYKTNA